MIVYQTSKLETKFRIVKNSRLIKKGTYTSMGWYVLDIQRYYNGRFYTEKEYYKLLDKKEIKTSFLQRYRRFFKKI